MVDVVITLQNPHIDHLDRTETEHGQHSPIPPYFFKFSAKLSVFSHLCLVFAIYLPISLPFLPVFDSSISNFCPMLRLAEQCDTKEWCTSAWQNRTGEFGPP